MSFNWNKIHSKVRTASESKYSAGQYADSVEAACKQINKELRNVLLSIDGSEKDGVPLVQALFGGDNPKLKFNDLRNRDQKNIQIGHMQMLTGLYTAIRNPLTKVPIELNKSEAEDIIVIASYLFNQIDKAKDFTFDNETKHVWIWVKDPDDHAGLVKLKEALVGSPGKTVITLLLGKEREHALRLPQKVRASNRLLDELNEIPGIESRFVSKTPRS